MDKKWVARMNDGRIVTEEDMNWSKVDIDNVKQLSLKINDTMISLPENAKGLVQAKTAGMPMGEKYVSIESRYIGFSLGNNNVIIRVDEKTNNITVETCQHIQAQ